MVRRSLALVAAAAVVAVLSTSLSGCGAAGQANPEEIGPRGVDELVVPTPDPDPADFVRRVDNPWLPLAPGTVWTYDASGGAAATVVVRVEDEPETVAGVPCAVVTWESTDDAGDAVGRGRAFYAQDRRGNVWLFGEVDEVGGDDPTPDAWRAGESGAEAGLAMPAAPRVGDGFAREAAGSTADRSTVESLDEERTVPAGTFAGLLLIEDASVPGTAPDTVPGTMPDTADTTGEHVVRRLYAEGVGLVQESTTMGGTTGLALRSVVPG